ncbi:DNA ligase [Yersinia phage vB_YpEc11]|uniref:DNA ligase n=1 Tax=Yersinia phage vB_YpEc11 TaxID=3056113 RepID=A0AA51VJ82_9CAUD|nr:DNA ligase [Yersinia phage vB_YpEc11]
MLNFQVKPYKAVDFKESAIESALAKAGSLIADVKYDGVRGILTVDGREEGHWAEFNSRVSKEIPALAYLAGENSERWERFMNDERNIYPCGIAFDGELMVKGVDFNTSSGLLRTMYQEDSKTKSNIKFSQTPVDGAKKSQKIPFNLDLKHLQMVVYAVLPLDEVKQGNDIDIPNCLMREHARNITPLLREYFPEIEWVDAESYDVFDMVSLNELYETKRSEGHEGLVVKDPLDIYKRGKKTGWWKMKPDDSMDGIVVGLNWGTKGLANEGKVIGFEVLLESGRVVSANNLTQALMDEFTKKVLTGMSSGELEAFVGDMSEEPYNPYGGWAIQVNFMEETPDGSLRHPSFGCWRGTESNPTEKM